MSSTLTASHAPSEQSFPAGSGEFAYRPLSLIAVLVFVLGLMSAATSLLWFLLVIPVINLCLGAAALLRIRAARGDLGGKKLALFGVMLSALALAGGLAYQFYVYQAEVPDGYVRLSFSKDISDRGTQMMNGSQADAQQLAALDGKQIFIKGFMYPSDRQKGLGSFLLVKDSGICCFGKEPAVTDMIGVYMTGSKTANYYSGRVSVAGTFRLNRQYTGANKMEPYFMLDGVTVNRSRSDFDPVEPAQLTTPAAQPAAATPTAEVAGSQPAPKA
jgi:hypothetical protein